MQVQLQIYGLSNIALASRRVQFKWMFKHHEYCKSFISIYCPNFHKIRHLWHERDNYERTRINLSWVQIKTRLNTVR